MDEEITKTPILNDELNTLVEKANKIYLKNFDGKVWFGRCIFLSWYCETGTCKFCFRSTQKHKIKNPADARRSLASVLAEAAMIKGFGWRLEFLTGGHGIFPLTEIAEIAKLCKQVLGEKIWLNLGTMKIKELEMFKSSTQGIVASVETTNKRLHAKVCPDKELKPYVKLLKDSEKMGFKKSITIIIGLGESKKDFTGLKEFIIKNPLDRITIYTLRPVVGTDYTKGPSTTDLIWWITQVRIAFPKLEIIVGSAKYRIKEISLILKAGANAFTKLPATNLFNTDKALEIEEEVKKAGRTLTSKFRMTDVRSVEWDKILAKVKDLKLRKDVKTTLERYLKKFEKSSQLLNKTSF